MAFFFFFFWLLLLLVGVHAVYDYGTDVSYPMHYNYRDGQVTESQQGLYEENIAGCVDHYKDNPCWQAEQDRIAMNLRQPQSMMNYTQNGFVKIRAPPVLWQLVHDFWNLHQNDSVLEEWSSGSTFVNHWKSPTHMVAIDNATLAGGGQLLKHQLWNAARSTLGDWVGGYHMADCTIWGIRIYHQGAILAPHVDRLPLVASAILNVDQDVDEPWPLEVIGHDGKAHNITMQPGDLVLYESHSIIHGRPFPLQGRFMANIFLHFEPVAPLSEPNPIFQGDLPPYLIPGSPEEPIWRQQNPNGWTAVQVPAVPTVGTTELHQAVIQENLPLVAELLLRSSSSSSLNNINAQDELGWTPLHEAVRTRRLDLVQLLVEQGGADIHARTKEGQSVLEVAHWFVQNNNSNSDNDSNDDPQQHPVIQYLTGLGATYKQQPQGGDNNEEL